MNIIKKVAIKSSKSSKFANITRGHVGGIRDVLMSNLRFQAISNIIYHMGVAPQELMTDKFIDHALDIGTPWSDICDIVRFVYFRFIGEKIICMDNRKNDFTYDVDSDWLWSLMKLPNNIQHIFGNDETVLKRFTDVFVNNSRCPDFTEHAQSLFAEYVWLLKVLPICKTDYAMVLATHLIKDWNLRPHAFNYKEMLHEITLYVRENPEDVPGGDSGSTEMYL